jgi:hypothetical protein
MIDITVARDKLAQFQYSSEIADFFRAEGIVGRPDLADSCAIAVWMKNQTGEKIYVSQSYLWNGDTYHDEDAIRYRHTDAMHQFTVDFDNGRYRDLVVEGDN